MLYHCSTVTMKEPSVSATCNKLSVKYLGQFAFLESCKIRTGIVCNNSVFEFLKYLKFLNTNNFCRIFVVSETIDEFSFTIECTWTFSVVCTDLEKTFYLEKERDKK